MSAQHLHLWLPDLRALSHLAPASLSLPHLSRCLSRAYAETWCCDDHFAGLFDLFGLATNAPLPIAPLTYLADTQITPDGVWLRADPVYLQADRDRMLLFDADQALTDLHATEVEKLLTGLNDFYAQQGWQFSAPTLHRWYLCLPQTVLPQVDFPSLAAWVGKDIRHAQFQGAEARQWRQFSTEIQMYLYQHEVNQQREAAGLLPINHLWLWGGGQLPTPPATRWQRVWSDEPLVQGLAMLSNAPIHTVPDSGQTCCQQLDHAGEYLLTLPVPMNTDPATWLQYLDDVWFAPLLRALQQRRLDTLVVYVGEQQAFCLTQAHAKHWWRWTQPWRVWLG